LKTRLPGIVHLPFDFRIKIRPVGRKVLNAKGLSDADGGWCVDERTIYIFSRLSGREKRYVLGHELVHALIDWIHFCTQTGVMAGTKRR
jgi:Zn-dependent peptidase ImmA (M78 family)